MRASLAPHRKRALPAPLPEQSATKTAEMQGLPFFPENITPEIVTFRLRDEGI
jgi:hypothetical protein